MQIKSGSLDERYIEVYEYDMINNTNVLILKAYGIKRDNGIWEFPAPQIFNSTVYKSNQTEYDNVVLGFRNDCQGKIGDDISVITTQINSLMKDNSIIVLAIAELAEQNTTRTESN